MRESQPRVESAPNIADGCRGACEAELPRIGLTTGRVGVNPGLLLTVFLVTVSEPDQMAGHRKVESPSLVPNQHRTSSSWRRRRARRTRRTRKQRKLVMERRRQRRLQRWRHKMKQAAAANAFDPTHLSWIAAATKFNQGRWRTRSRRGALKNESLMLYGVPTTSTVVCVVLYIHVCVSTLLIEKNTM